MYLCAQHHAVIRGDKLEGKEVQFYRYEVFKKACPKFIPCLHLAFKLV